MGQGEAATKLFGIMVLAILAEVETEPLAIFLAFLSKPFAPIRAFVVRGVANRALTFIMGFHLLSPLARLYARLIEFVVSASLLRTTLVRSGTPGALKLFAANTLDFPFSIFLLPRLRARALFSVTLLNQGAVKFPTGLRRFAFAVVAVVSHFLSLLMRSRAQLNYLRAALRLPRGAPGLVFLFAIFLTCALERIAVLPILCGSMLSSLISCWTRLSDTPNIPAAILGVMILLIFAVLPFFVALFVQLFFCQRPKAWNLFVVAFHALARTLERKVSVKHDFRVAASAVHVVVQVALQSVESFLRSFFVCVKLVDLDQLFRHHVLKEMLSESRLLTRKCAEGGFVCFLKAGAVVLFCHCRNLPQSFNFKLRLRYYATNEVMSSVISLNTNQFIRHTFASVG